MRDSDKSNGETRGTALRAMFIRAAREILGEPDTALDLRKVAERAGRSRTAPYLVFGRTEDGGGLDALRLAVAVSGLRELTAALEEVLARTADPEATFTEAGRVYFEFAQENPRLFRLMFGAEVAQALRAATAGAADAWRARAELEGLLRSVVERCQEVGALPRGHDTAALLTGVWALLHGSAMLQLDGQLEPLGFEATPDAAAGVAASLLLDGAALPVAAAARALLESELQRGIGFTASPSSALRGIAAEGPAASAPPRPLDEIRAVLGRSSALRRARRMRGAIDGSRILWIDDAPEQSEPERRTLAELGAEVVAAHTTDEALERLAPPGPRSAARRTPPFDVIISDIARPASPAAGVEGLPRLRAAAPTTPVVFYVRHLDPDADRPTGAFGITNRPSELLHLVLDVLERTRV